MNHPIIPDSAEQNSPTLNQNPLVIWFTGLPCSGKTTLASHVEKILSGEGFKSIFLDGDEFRKQMSSDLGFSKKDRIENLRRAGETAKIIVDSGIIVLAAFISPFSADREKIRKRIGAERFVEVYLDCPLHICEKRDVKGHYSKARQGTLKEFTGIDSPYEVPANPEITIPTSKINVVESSRMLIQYLTPRIATKDHPPDYFFSGKRH